MWPVGFRRFASVILILGTALALLPEARAGCSNTARPVPWRGLWATMIPTPTASDFGFSSKGRPYMWTTRQKILVSLSLMLIVVIHSGAAISASYPEKPIEFTVPFAAGGGSDIM